MNKDPTLTFLAGIVIGIFIGACAIEARWQKKGYEAARIECEVKLPRDLSCVFKPEGSKL